MEKLCRLLEISRSGYYAWLTRRQSQRAQHNQALTRELVYLHEKYPALGLDSLYHMLKANNFCSKADMLLYFVYRYAVYRLCTEWRQLCGSHGEVRTHVI